MFNFSHRLNVLEKVIREVSLWTFWKINQIENLRNKMYNLNLLTSDKTGCWSCLLQGKIWRYGRAIIPQTQSHLSETFSAACRHLISLTTFLIKENNDIFSITVSRSEIRNSCFILYLILLGRQWNKKRKFICFHVPSWNRWRLFSDICIQRSFWRRCEDRGKTSEGLILNESQMDILNESRRSKHPDKISCYKLLRYFSCIFKKNKRIWSKERW